MGRAEFHQCEAIISRVVLTERYSAFLLLCVSFLPYPYNPAQGLRYTYKFPHPDSCHKIGNRMHNHIALLYSSETAPML